MDKERAALLGKSYALIASLSGDGWDSSGSASQIVPVIFGSNENALSAAGFLQGQGFAARAIRPPTVPSGTARLRLSLTARIRNEHLTGILAALKAWRTSRIAFATVGASAGRA
jgi:8-amino-7-oxononanoate synthase